MIRTILFFSLLVMAAGCSGAPSTGDQSTAKDAVKTALEAWKSGGAAAGLASGTPAMTVSDYRWESGFKLTKYAIADDTSKSGFDVRIPVDLWLTPPKGKPIREKAYYNVVTSPTLTVVRDPEP